MSKEDLISPIMEVLGNYRNEVRKFARAKEFGKIFQISDVLRDEYLPVNGIRLEDKG